MSAGKRRTLRVVVLAVWLALTLIAVGPVLAQGGGGTSVPDSSAQTGDPQDLDDVAVRLMPLLVGAALIERTLEILFNWVERALLDASHTLNRLATRVTGLVQVDFRQAWQNLDELTNAMLRRETPQEAPYVGDSDSADPAEWPLAMLEERLREASATLETAQTVLEKALASPEYVARKKMAAAWLSIGLGIALALVGSLRLFEPLGVDVADWFEDAFDVFDLILAGILMGLGTEWVHQVIGLLIKGKGFLGRAGTGSGQQIDPEQVRMLAELAVKETLETQANKLREDLEKEFSRPDSPPG
jgi:hypothetical protein